MDILSKKIYVLIKNESNSDLLLSSSIDKVDQTVVGVFSSMSKARAQIKFTEMNNYKIVGPFLLDNGMFDFDSDDSMIFPPKFRDPSLGPKPRFDPPHPFNNSNKFNDSNKFDDII